MKYFLIGLALSVFIWLILIISNKKDERLFAVSECVHVQAVEHGYAGDIFGRDSWDRFYKLCQ